MVHAGLGGSAGPLDMRKLTLQEVTVIGTYTYTRPDLLAALDLLRRDALGPLDWLEERPLNQGAGAFADLDAGRTPAAKILLRPGAV